MAFLELHYRSDALKMEVSVNVILPDCAMAGDGATYKTLYLLHGLTNDYTCWMRRSSIERYAADYQLAVVMPSVGRSWYTDTPDGAKYLTFVGEELPRVCRSYFRGMTDAPEDNLVIGHSMGGYGAMKVALTYPRKFGYVGALSGAFDISRFGIFGSIAECRRLFGNDLVATEDLRGSKHDVFRLMKNRKKEGMIMPKLYLWCGESDALLPMSRSFHTLLDELSVEHLYEESAGDHEWGDWDLHIQSALKYLLQ